MEKENRVYFRKVSSQQPFQKMAQWCSSALRSNLYTKSKRSSTPLPVNEEVSKNATACICFANVRPSFSVIGFFWYFSFNFAIVSRSHAGQFLWQLKSVEQRERVLQFRVAM